MTTEKGQVMGYNGVGRARCERPGRGRFPKEEPTVGKRIGQKAAWTHLPEAGQARVTTRGPRWRFRCVACRVMFDRPEYSDETKCPRCLAALLAENSRGYTPKPLPKARLAKHGMTQDDFHQMAAKQSGTCAICQRAPQGHRALIIDHNHDSGKVRGLLCDGCNTGLGFFGDDPATLTKAAAYLRKRGDYSHIARTRAVRSDTLSEVILDD